MTRNAIRVSKVIHKQSGACYVSAPNVLLCPKHLASASMVGGKGTQCSEFSGTWRRRAVTIDANSSRACAPKPER